MADELLIGLGLVLVIEGLIYSLFPGGAKRLAEEVLNIPEASLRIGGLAAVAVGVAIVWLVRG